MHAAFDTVNHKILIKVLENYFGILEKASNWIMSYLQIRQFQVHINGASSEKLQQTTQYHKGVYLVLYCLTATQAPFNKSCPITYQGMQTIPPVLNPSSHAAPQSKKVWNVQ